MAIPQTPPASSSLRVLLDADWQYWMSQYPEVATQIGVPGHDGRWTDYSPAAIAARSAHLRETAARLASMARAALPSSEQLDYDLYRQLIDAAVEGLAFENDALPLRGVFPVNLAMPISQMGGVQQDAPRTIAIMPRDDRADYDRILERLDRLPALIDQTIALMAQGVAKGLVPPTITMRDVPGQVKAQIVSAPLESPLLAAFKAFPPSIPDADRPRLTTSASDVYTQKVAPAFTRLLTYLETTYLPACRDTIAVDALPAGAAMYAYNVAWHTTTTLTPKEIHAIGIEEVRRIRGEMDKVIAASGFKGSFAEFTTYLRTDPRFYYTDAGELVRAYRDVAKRADPELAHLFGTLPRLPYGVKAVPDAVAPSQTTAYYESGAPAAGRPGYMFANTYKLASRPKWEMEALTLHEAVPGHHLQIALAQELIGLPEFRKHSSYTAFVEGWALYAERLGEEMHFYTDPYAKFGQLTYQMWRAVRLVVDTGMHSLGWPRDRASAFFRDNSAKTEQDINVEIDRYIAWPGQALGYKIGELRIKELRASAEKTLAAKFDVRAFHDVLHQQGAVPLDVLERRVKEWVASYSSAANAR
jgi:uncharacterized protein (DUF885 family)